MVYLGDTRDASNIVELAMDCDLIVHEVTGPEPRKDLLKRKVQGSENCVSYWHTKIAKFKPALLS